MSGQYPEPDAMREFALGLGVPSGAILIDNSGLRTYDSCYRAKEIFTIDEAILVTQEFHLPRALYLCDSQDILVTGVAAENYHYRRSSVTFWSVRETLATVVAFWDVFVDNPQVDTE